MGSQVVPLKVLTPQEPKEFTLDLLKNTNISDPQKKHRGKVVVELTYAPFREDSNGFSGLLDGFTRKESESDRPYGNESPSGAGVLMVTVQGAEDVEGEHHNNPYALVLFRGEAKKSKVSYISIKYVLYDCPHTPLHPSIFLLHKTKNT